MSKPLTSKQVLELLGLKDRHIVGYLVERELLPRIEMGPRTFRYEQEDVEDLLMRCKTQGLLLTAKPSKAS